jgi:hypothetical protein
VSCVLLAGTSAYAMIRGKMLQPGFVCNTNNDMTEAGQLLAWGSQVFYYQKYWEFMDTFIFMLRKRYRQVRTRTVPLPPLLPRVPRPVRAISIAPRRWRHCPLPFICTAPCTPLTTAGSTGQVSFLHVYHHSSITIIVAMYASFDSNGDCFLGVMLNSIVHVLMYSHYFVSAFKIATPWKPFLTSMYG